MSSFSLCTSPIQSGYNLVLLGILVFFFSLNKLWYFVRIRFFKYNHGESNSTRACLECRWKHTHFNPNKLYKAFELIFMIKSLNAFLLNHRFKLNPNIQVTLINSWELGNVKPYVETYVVENLERPRVCFVFLFFFFLFLSKPYF